jgi:hypothetical protein
MIIRGAYLYPILSFSMVGVNINHGYLRKLALSIGLQKQLNLLKIEKGDVIPTSSNSKHSSEEFTFDFVICGFDADGFDVYYVK